MDKNIKFEETSFQISVQFKKRHFKVLKQIENLIQEGHCLFVDASNKPLCAKEEYFNANGTTGYLYALNPAQIAYLQGINTKRTKKNQVTHLYIIESLDNNKLFLGVSSNVNKSLQKFIKTNKFNSYNFRLKYAIKADKPRKVLRLVADKLKFTETWWDIKLDNLIQAINEAILDAQK